MRLRMLINGHEVLNSGMVDLINRQAAISGSWGLGVGLNAGDVVEMQAINKEGQILIESFTKEEPEPWGFHNMDDGSMGCNFCGGEVLGFEEGLICAKCGAGD